MGIEKGKTDEESELARIRQEAKGIYEFYKRHCGEKAALEAYVFAVKCGECLYHHRRSLNFAMGVRLALSNRPYTRSLDTAA